MRTWRLPAAIATALLILVGGGPAAAETAGTPELVIDAGPYVGTRAPDGTTELKIGATNLTPGRVLLRLETSGGSCDPARGEPAVEPFTRAQVAFQMMCESGSAARSATLSSPALDDAVGLSFTVTEAVAPSWAPLAWFAPAVPAAATAVLVPFLFWRRNPAGNTSAGTPRDDPLPWAGILGKKLPGITKDWSLTDNWASSVTLAGGLFTAIFASTDLLPSILGPSSMSKATVVAAAAALSAALVAAGPLWLTILKRRTAEDSGVARHNTVAGVLAASGFVLVGAFGGPWAIAAVIDSAAAYGAATAVTGLLVLYSAKSIPQTLALGAYAEPTTLARREQAVSASL